jgi:hypothetical protein
MGITLADDCTALDRPSFPLISTRLHLWTDLETICIALEFLLNVALENGQTPVSPFMAPQAAQATRRISLAVASRIPSTNSSKIRISRAEAAALSG